MDSQEKRSSAGATHTEMSMQELQQRAEVALQQRGIPLPEIIGTMSPDALHLAFHELRVHQIELEMQNEELRRARDELDTSQARYFDLYDMAPVGYCTVGGSGLIQQANLTVATLLGMGRAGLVQQRFTRFIALNDQDAFYLLRQKIMRTGEAQDCELRMVKQDGAQIWVHLQAVAAVDEKGAPCIRIVLTNITERKQIESALQEGEERYRTLVEWTPQAVAVHRNGRILYVNPAAMRMFGAAGTSEMIGTRMLDWVHPEFHQIVVDRMKDFAERGISSPMMVEKLLKLDGTVMDVEVQGTVISYEGEPALQVALRDVTEHMKVEALVQASLRLSKFGINHTLDEMLRRTLDEAEVLTESQIGFFHFLMDDQETLQLQNWSTHTLQTACTADRHTRHYAVEQAGVWADCIRERQPIIHNDYTSLAHRKGLPVGHAPIQRELIVPILRGDNIVGILGVGNKPVDYNWRDVENVSRLADLAWDVVIARRAEDALKEATRHWQTTFNAAQDAICLLDFDQRILQANTAMAELTRMSTQDMIGRHCWELVHGTTMPIAECPLRRARTSLQREQMDLQIGKRWLNITVDPVLGPDQEFQGAVHLMHDITERKQLEEHVRQMAFHDTLTGLPNRRLLIDRLTQALNFSKRTEHHGALLFLDLDNFKTLNDAYGHEAGDLLLMEVAKRLSSCVREIDTVSRFGGDEFAILLGDLAADKAESTTQAGIIAEKVRTKLAEPYLLAIRHVGDVAATIEHLCTASIGVAVFINHDCSEDDILRRSDAAMYKAKQDGRSLVRFYEEVNQL